MALRGRIKGGFEPREPNGPNGISYYRVAASSIVFHAQFDVALVVDARCIGEFVRLEVHLRLRFVLVVRELSHNLAVHRATEIEMEFPINCTSNKRALSASRRGRGIVLYRRSFSHGMNINGMFPFICRGSF